MPFDDYLIRSQLPVINDWPTPGERFRDITSLFANPKIARMMTDTLVLRYIDSKVTHIVALESQGFLIGSNLAYALNKPLVLIRKPGKLAGPIDNVRFNNKVLEMQQHALQNTDHVVLIDGVIGTGSSLLAATQLVKTQGATILEATTLLDLVSLGGSQKLGEAGVASYSLVLLED